MNNVDGAVTAFDYSNLTPVFCDISLSNIIDMGINLSVDPSVPHFWVLIKKKIICYQYLQGQFIQFAELPLGDTPLAVSWLKDTLFLQFKDHIQCINIHSSSVVSDLKIQIKNANLIQNMKLMETGGLLALTSPTTFSSIIY